MLHSLKLGLTKDDLKVVINNRQYFSLPDHSSNKLFRHHLKLKALGSILSLLTRKAQRERYLKSVLENLVRTPLNYWSGHQGPAPERDCKAELILYSLRSPRGFNWDSPIDAFLSLNNYFTIRKYHSIGHLYVELRENKKTIALTGMTGETNSQVYRRLILKNLGLGFLFATYPGRLETSESVSEELLHHSKEKRVAYARFRLQQDQLIKCKNFLKYWSESGMYQKYGIWQNPLRKEGAGCASFAIAFLELCGLMKADYHREWRQRINIPHDLLGSPTMGKAVSFPRFLYRLILGPRRKNWAKTSEPHQVLQFWDPDQFYRWIEREFQNHSYPSETNYSAKGLILR